MSETPIAGYASLFDVEDLGGDVVAPGAFAGSLDRGHAIPMLYQHEAAEPVGYWSRIAEDRHGLRVEGVILAATARQRQVAELVRRGALDGLSIGFRTRKYSALDRGRRRLVAIDLWEISIVTFPMLPQARLHLQTQPARAA